MATILSQYEEMCEIYERYLNGELVPAKPKRGHWIYKGRWQNGMTEMCKAICSECKWEMTIFHRYGTPFCPNCGANMHEKRRKDGKAD